MGAIMLRIVFLVRVTVWVTLRVGGADYAANDVERLYGFRVMGVLGGSGVINMYEKGRGE
jgi:hypothetical protein